MTASYDSPRWMPLDDGDLDPDPLVQFECWWDDAREVLREPEAICLATASRSGQPRARMVLLRQHGEEGFGFFTDYRSQKGADLAENPKAALLWFVEPLGRQVRIEGSVVVGSDDASDAYFAGRPRGNQVASHASHQSQPISSRDALEQAVLDAERRFEGADVPRPADSGLYLLRPERYEFWQQRESRLHDRFRYERAGDHWQCQRLQP